MLVFLNETYTWAPLHLQVELLESKQVPIHSQILFINDVNGDGIQEVAVLNNKKIIEVYTISSLDSPILSYNISKYITKAHNLNAKIIDVQGTSMLVVVGASFVNETHEALQILCYSIQSSDSLLWHFEKAFQYSVSYTFADINNDSVEDVIAATPFSVFVIDLKARQLLWERNIDYDDISNIVLVGDVNGDKRIEVVRCSENLIYVLSSDNGKILSKLKFGTLDEKYDYFSATIYDINNDGAEDVIYAREGKGIYAISFSKNNIRGMSWGFLWSLSLSVAPMKVSVYRDTETYVYVRSCGKISVINAQSGELIWSKEIPLYYETVDDIDSDDLLELVSGYNNTFYFIRLLDGTILHNFTVDLNCFLNLTSQNKEDLGEIHDMRETIHTYTTWTKPIVIDLNNDSKKEIIVGANMFAKNKQGLFLLIIGSNGELILKKMITEKPMQMRIYYCSTSSGNMKIIIFLEPLDTLLNKYSELRIYNLTITL
ncbi:MAG: VCBS repeat-containing protein [Candidatus Asgardarchaeum sp.]